MLFTVFNIFAKQSDRKVVTEKIGDFGVIKTKKIALLFP